MQHKYVILKRCKKTETTEELITKRLKLCKISNIISGEMRNDD